MVEFFFKEAEKNFDPLHNFFQGADKERTLRILFFNVHRQNFEDLNSSHPSGRGGGGCGKKMKNPKPFTIQFPVEWTCLMIINKFQVL